MGIFDFFKRNKKDKNNTNKESRLVEKSFDKKQSDRSVLEPRIENGVLKAVLNHHIKDGIFIVPINVHTIVSFAFMNCDNLETLVLHDGIRYIDTGAFSCWIRKSIRVKNY